MSDPKRFCGGSLNGTHCGPDCTANSCMPECSLVAAAWAKVEWITDTECVVSLRDDKTE